MHTCSVASCGKMLVYELWIVMSDDAKFMGTEKSMVMWETIGWLGLMGLGLMCVIDRVPVYQGFSDGSLCDEWEWSHNSISITISI